MSTSQRKTSSHLPYVPVLQEPFYKLEIKYERPKLISPSNSLKIKCKYDEGLSKFRNPSALAYEKSFETPLVKKKLCQNNKIAEG